MVKHELVEFFGLKLRRCSEVDVDDDIDVLITGACLEIGDGEFLILEEILNQELDPSNVESQV